MLPIFLVGPMGVGKSTIGKLLAAELSYCFMDSDREIEQRAGADVSWIFDVEGEVGFRKREAAIIKELSQRHDSVIATGGGAILNIGTRQLLKEAGYTFYINAPLSVLLERTSQDRSRPLLQVKDPRASFQRILSERQSLYKEVSRFELSSSEFSSKEIVSKIVSKIVTHLS